MICSLSTENVVYVIEEGVYLHWGINTLVVKSQPNERIIIRIAIDLAA